MADPFVQKFAYGIRSTKTTPAVEEPTVDHGTNVHHEKSSIGGGNGNGGGLINTSSPNLSRLSRSPARHYRSTVGDERQSSRSPLPPEKRRSSKEGRIGTAGIGRLHGSESHLKQKIQALEDTVAEYERQKFNVMGTFAEYRERVAERERKLEAEYSAKIITLSEDVLAAKKDFEERMKQFQALQEKFEREKEAALEKLRQEHQKEIQCLEERCSEAQLLNLEQKYILEIQRLEEERKSLKSEKEKLGEAFESKLRRAQSLYETELTAAKSLYTKELEAFHGHEEALKDELLGRQEEFKDRLEDLQQQFHNSKDELAKCKQEVVELEQRLQQKEAEIQAISKQLQEARQENDEALARMRNAETELFVTKQKCQEQEEQLLRKSDILNVLETAKNKLEIVIQDLQLELKSLKNKVTFLENERQNLESQSETQVQLQNSQLQTLEMVLDNVSKEKETVKDQYEQQLEEERIKFEEREFALKKEYTVKLNELEKQQKIFQDKIDMTIGEERLKLEQIIRLEFENKMKSVTDEKSLMEREIERLNTIISNSHEESKPLETCNLYENHQHELEELKSIIEKSLRLQLQSEIREESNAETPPTDRNDNLPPNEDGAELNETMTNLRTTISELEEKIKHMEEDTRGDHEIRLQLEEVQKLNESLSSELTTTKLEFQENEEKQNAKIDELSRLIELQKEQLETSAQRELDLQEQLELKETTMITAVEQSLEKLPQDIQQFQHIARSMDLSLGQNMDSSLQKIETDVSMKEKQFEELSEQMRSLTNELESVNKELNQKTQEILHIRNETKEYIRRREQQQTKAHKREIEKLKDEHQNSAKKQQEIQDQLKNELEKLKIKLVENVAEVSDVDPNEDPVESTSKSGELEELRQQLERRDSEIRRLQEEKQTLENDLQQMKTSTSENIKETRDPRSVLSSPIGSMDSLRKRDSISSVGSAKDAPMCKKAVNMAIINKWHCLVDQIKSGDQKRDSKSSSSSTISKFMKSTHSSHQHHKNQGSSQDVSSSQKEEKQQQAALAKEEKIEIDASSVEQERVGRSSAKSPAPGVLKPQESRRSSGKSPGRSPVPKPKIMPISKRPAWRL